jgi:hypothetical protein
MGHKRTFASATGPAGPVPWTVLAAEVQEAAGVSIPEGVDERAAASGAAVDLYWLPLGAGGHSVRYNGVVYEAVSALLQRRPRAGLYHSALEIVVPGGRFTVEMTPVPDRRSWERGVVAGGPVGMRRAGWLRIFRYEVRCWREGAIPDLEYAVASPVRLTTDAAVAAAVVDLLPAVPTPTWGRDELGAGEMWSCNSIISWVLTRAGIDPTAIPRPPRARAPGWDAGVTVARRDDAAWPAAPRRLSAAAGRWR